MKIVKKTKTKALTIKRIIYDDKIGVSELFLPKIWINFCSKKQTYILKTCLGTKIRISKSKLRKLDLRMIKMNIGTIGRPHYSRFMTINRPKDKNARIPLLKMSKKLNKIYKGSVDIEYEYDNREQLGYTWWRD